MAAFDIKAGISSKQAHSQRQGLSAQMQRSLKLLSMSLADLRQELTREMQTNPVIADVEPTLEKSTLSDEEGKARERDELSKPDYPEDDYDPMEEYAASTAVDTEAMERRDRLFELQVKEETLAEHLIRQLPLSSIPPEHHDLAEQLIGDFDENGYFKGSLADAQMVSGESERTVLETLKGIATLDPLGCGARTHQECLLAQLSEIKDPILRLRVEGLIKRHWEDMAANRLEKIERDLKINHREYADALKALRTLDPRPGRSYRSSYRGAEYVNPEIHAEKCADGWVARVDSRGLPEIKISSKYLNLLHDPNADEETKEYVRQKIQAAKNLVEAVKNRQETVEGIAQAIFDAQPGFFEHGFKGLRPLTETAIAEQVGVDVSTVSRTVRDKYASTPKGTVELRKFFVKGIKTASGEQISTDDVRARLRALVEGEDKANPLSDEKLSQLLKAEGFAVARRTVAKYREQLGIRTKESRGRK